MGTIAEKLTYLNETKNAIKEAIVNKGVSVNDSDTFRSYADKISSIEAGGGTGGDAELEASFISSIDDSLGANVTKLPSGLTSIGKRAFYEKTNLVSPKLPDSITSIGEEAFRNCTNLALTELPSNLTLIGGRAFYYCSKLKLTELPDSITSIGEYAFYRCEYLALTKLPDSLTSVGTYAFYYCSKLKLTELPSNLTSIGDKCFHSALSSYGLLNIKGDVKSIGMEAFRYAGVSNVKLPNVTSVPTLGSYAFENTSISKGTGYIYVPDDLVESFKTASNWSTYANQIKGLSELPTE